MALKNTTPCFTLEILIPCFASISSFGKHNKLTVFTVRAQAYGDFGILNSRFAQVDSEEQAKHTNTSISIGTPTFKVTV